MTDIEQRVMEFFNSDEGFGALPPKCAASLRTGKPCTNYAIVRLDVGVRCARHLPRAVQELVRARQQRFAQEDEAKYEEWASAVEARIIRVYDKAAPYRRVPPPEILGRGLLWELQEGVCFICLSMGSGTASDYLLEDHSHETGMIRALLCRSCNSLEGRGNQRPWMLYRAYAPGNGLYCRYYGMNAEWQPGYPDPLPNKVPMKIDLLEIGRNPSGVLERYKQLIKTLPDTEIPESCQRRFEFGRPMLLRGERYATREERPSSHDWPIVRDETSDT